MTAAIGFKRLGLALAAVLVVGAGVLTIISFLISADAARDTVKAEIRSISGLEPVLRGSVSVSFFPFGAVSFEDVAIGKDAAGTAALTADRLIARLRFFPLLIGQIQVSDVTLVRPTINVMLDSTGKTNWTPLAGTLSAALQPDAERTASFSEIRIDDGTVVIRDDARTIEETITHIEGSLAWPSMFRSFAATGRFDWHGERIETSLSLSDFAAALAGNQSGVRLRITGAPMKFVFDGQLSSRPTWKIEGTVAADSPSLREAVRWAWNKQLPGGGFKRFSLKAKTNLVGSTLALSSADIEIDGNTAEGVLTFASDGRKTLQGTLAAAALDLTPYVSTIRLMDEREWNSTPIAFDNLAGIDLDLRLSAAHARIAKVKFGRTAIAANLRGGQLTVTVGESQSFGGTIRGSIDLTQSPSGVADVKAQIQFVDVDMQNCLDALLGTPRIEGKGNLAFNVEGTGTSMMAITKTLTGSAALSGQKGAVTGLNAEQLLRRLERQPLSGGGDYKNGRTPYDRFNVALNINQGIVSTEEIRMDGPTVRLNLRGNALIPARSLDFKGTANLVTGTSEGSGFELPFTIRGVWDDPLMQLDTDSLIRRAPAAAGLLEAIRNRASRDTTRSVIDKLVGSPATPAAKTDEN